MSQNHHHTDRSTSNLKLAFWMNLGFSIFEIIGGIYVNSVAVVSDAIHDLGDSLSLGTAWYCEKKSKQKADDQYSYGYGRYSLLGALINSMVLLLGSGFVIYAAIDRLIHPESSDALGMIVFAIVGIAVNGFVVLRMRSSKKLNEKVVFWHMLEDVLGWTAVLIAAIVMYFYPTPYIDPILSLAITGYILYGVFGRLKETLYFFLQGVPKEVQLSEIRTKILALPNVSDVNHAHVWSLDGEQNIFSAHVTVYAIKNIEQVSIVKSQVKEILKPHHLKCSTIDIEIEEE
ncbi:cation diffusion facilitator family transporter [Brumimicrobium aurantiacum]|uniref:Cation transporter n=1 Tax=Brumimicrobium aurantiacum TaxID=1737063 RepID=A0A3E1EVR7_9FLAO|nr:cation diffusion facilitator family transporter [Brumimicrobium aurantiacum]RFC53654.1 cation transporter [Brumimicrobium aurantiacum]